jgi:carboxyl-terminal processing protease
VTSDITGSAGEIFTLHLRSQPQVTQVGGTTRGALSDQLEKTLGEGWTFTLSSEIYKDSTGFSPEALGVKPDIDFPIFDGADLSTTHALAIQTLLEYISDDDPILAVPKNR